MKAVNDFVVIKKVKEEQVKVAGLELTEKLDTDNRYIKCKIISVGNLFECIVKENDSIYYDKHAGHGITHKDKFYQVIRVRDIVLIE